MEPLRGSNVIVIWLLLLMKSLRDLNIIINSVYILIKPRSGYINANTTYLTTCLKPRSGFIKVNKLHSAPWFEPRSGYINANTTYLTTCLKPRSGYINVNKIHSAPWFEPRSGSINCLVEIRI